MSSNPREIPWMFRLFWILPILTGAIVATNVLLDLQRAERSTGWQAVDATVVRVGGQRGLLRDQRWGEYRWEYGGRELRGSDASCCGGGWGDFIAQQGEVKPGDPVRIYIDADDPTRAVLVTGSSWRCFLPLIAAALLAGAGLYLRHRITADEVGRVKGF